MSDFTPDIDKERLAEVKVAKAKSLLDFLFFTRYFFMKMNKRRFIVEDHHVKIAEALQKVVAGKTKRLIINVPPRFGKTELAVKYFIAYGLALNPAAKFIHLSYSDDLALDNSEVTRDIIMSPEYREMFQLITRKDSKSKKKWYTKPGGGVYATSAGGQVTGFGAGNVDELADTDDEEQRNIDNYLSDIDKNSEFGGAIIIDDPIKPDDADSPTKRGRVNNRFDSTIRNRVNSRNTPIIVIMQRLHPQDLSGYLQKIEPGEWEVLELPAMREDGTAACPRVMNVEDLKKLKVYNPKVYWSQYQQKPREAEGLLLPEAELKTFKMKDFNRRIVESKIGAIDPADEGADKLSFPIGYMVGQKVYIVDVVYTAASVEVTTGRCAREINDRGMQMVRIETNSAGKYFGKEMRKLCTAAKIFFKINTKNKHTRIVMAAGFIKEHFVFRDDYEPGSEYDLFMQHVTSYPADGKTEDKDAADSLAELYSLIMVKFKHLYK